MSGDTVVGKQADPVNAQLTTCGIYQWLVKNNLRLSLLLQMVQTISWRFPLTVEASMSTWATVAAPNSTVRKVNMNIHLTHQSFSSRSNCDSHSSSLFVPHSSVGHRRVVCACPLLAESWGGAVWSVGGYQPGGCSAGSRKQHNWRPNHS